MGSLPAVVFEDCTMCFWRLICMFGEFDPQADMQLLSQTHRSPVTSSKCVCWHGVCTVAAHAVRMGMAAACAPPTC